MVTRRKSSRAYPLDVAAVLVLRCSRILEGRTCYPAFFLWFDQSQSMTPKDFKKAFPFVSKWITQTLSENSAKAKPVGSLNFKRLPLFYSNDLLARAKVVFVEKCPVPPLSSIGLNQFADFENMEASGITYLDTYFILKHEAKRESLHFHELVHVIQWQILGAERFLAFYAEGLEKQGYRDSPLEVMAYDHEARFNVNVQPYSVEFEVRQQLQRFA